MGGHVCFALQAELCAAIARHDRPLSLLSATTPELLSWCAGAPGVRYCYLSSYSSCHIIVAVIALVISVQMLQQR